MRRGLPCDRSLPARAIRRLGTPVPRGLRDEKVQLCAGQVCDAKLAKLQVRLKPKTVAIADVRYCSSSFVKIFSASLIKTAPQISMILQYIRYRSIGYIKDRGMPASHDYLLKFEFRILIRKIQKRVSVKRRATYSYLSGLRDILPTYRTLYNHGTRRNEIKSHGPTFGSLVAVDGGSHLTQPPSSRCPIVVVCCEVHRVRE